MTTFIDGGCNHTRKGLRQEGPTASYPPAAVICLDCGSELVTIEEAKVFVAAADGKFHAQTHPDPTAKPEEKR
jgi:hypothetical protein